MNKKRFPKKPKSIQLSQRVIQELKEASRKTGISQNVLTEQALIKFLKIKK
ncbi:ribbon-helix-helix domain-containing protein [Persephonella sp.]